jgi:hypothetical protein
MYESNETLVHNVSHEASKLQLALRVSLRWGLSLVSFVIAIAIGLASKFYVGPFERWVSQDLNGVFYAMVWVFLLAVLVPIARPRNIAIAAVAICIGIEFLQLWHPHFLEVLRAEPLGRLVLGSSFTFYDMPYYVVGGWLGVLWLNRLPQPVADLDSHIRPYGVPA